MATYRIVFNISETITLADDSTETIRKIISSIEEDGTALTEQSSLALVNANPGSYWFNIDKETLYIHCSGGDDPGNYTLIGFFWLYFGTHGIQLNNKYYEPYISEKGLPALSQKNLNVHWGISNIGSGSITLLNGRGYFDQISKKFIWINKVVRLLMGGDNLPYSEYQALFVGKIRDKIFTKQTFILQLKSMAFDLLRTLPINNFWTSTYSNLDPDAEGNPIPYYYGSYSVQQAPIVTCINTAYAANTYQFKICDHAIKSITQVYIDYGDGTGWGTISHGNEDLTNATFTIVSASFVIGTSRVKVSFDGIHSEGTLIEDPPSIVEDILINFCGYDTSDLHSSSFTISKARTEMTLNVPIDKDTKTLSIIEKICASDLAFFDEDGDGKLRYRTWEPELGTPPVIDETDILEKPLPSVKDDTVSLFWKIKIGYSYLCSQEKNLYAEESNFESRYKYEKEEVHTHETYLRGASDATRLGQRLLLILKNPSPLLTIGLKAAQITKTLGDKLKIILSRAPLINGGYDERPFEIFGISKSFYPLLVKIEARDLPDYASNVGFWTLDTMPNYSNATEIQRQESGFWTDDDGYADTGDEDSLHVSLWW